jgi:hypothetical protein
MSCGRMHLMPFVHWQWPLVLTLPFLCHLYGSPCNATTSRCVFSHATHPVVLLYSVIMCTSAVFIQVSSTRPMFCENWTLENKRM